MTRRLVFRAVAIGLASAGFVWSWSVERASLERANRLQRSGRFEEAARLYERRTLSDPTDPELRYNLGSTLAALGAQEAELELSRALAGGTREIRGRAQYNTGHLRLTRALSALEPDSVREHAALAVTANRAAIRMRPQDADAKWNLAMSLRLLDSIDAVRRSSGRELDDGAVQADVVTRSVNVPDPAEDERAEDPPAEGEDETVVTVGEESPLSPEEAAEILGRSHLDPTDIVTKLLALEGRSRFGRQQRGVRRW